MIGEYGNKLVFIFGLQKIFNRTCRKSGKRFICRREHGERPFSLQRLYQTSGLNRGDERIERTSLNGGVDNVCGLNGAGD